MAQMNMNGVAQMLIRDDRMQCPLALMLKRCPQATAIASQTQKISYAQLAELVQVRCEVLRQRSGADRIALVTSNPVSVMAWLIAAARCSVLLVLVDADLSQSVLARRLKQCEPQLVVAETQLVHPDCPSIRDEALQSLITPDKATAQDSAIELLDVNTPLSAIFTSGTTGEPKLVVHSLANHFYSAKANASFSPMEEDDCWLLCLPVHHIAGLAIVFRCLFSGAKLFFSDNKQPIQETMIDAKATHVSLVGTQLLRLQKAGFEPGMTCLKHVLVGGSALSPAIIDWLQSWPQHLWCSYGMSEMASTVMACELMQPPTFANALPHQSVLIGADNEIWVKGQTLCLGYWRNGELIGITDNDGWFHTSDLVAHTDLGLQIAGRKDNLFISGGKNVQPEEIEFHLLRMSGVSKCLVLPVPDEVFGHRPVACIEADETLTLTQLHEFLADKIEKYKWPVRLMPLSCLGQEIGAKPNRQILLKSLLAILANK